MSFADFNVYLFTVLSYKCKYDSFSEFCESFWQITEHKGGVADPQLRQARRRGRRKKVKREGRE